MKLINPEIRFEVTNICNAKCIMCPREKMHRPQGVLGMGLYKRVLDEAISYGATQVSLENFGEPLCDPHFVDRIKYAKAKGMYVLSITNASLLTEEKADEIIHSGLDVLRISIYGVSKETYEKVHKGLNFETMKKNVAKLFENREKINGLRKKPEINVYFLVMDENIHEMEAFKKIWEPVADNISIWKPHNWGDGRCYRKSDAVRKSCGRPMVGPVQVQWDGKVVPCCFDYDSQIVLGDLNRQTLREVLSGKEYNALRDAHEKGKFDKFPFCNCCDQLQKRNDVMIYSNIKNAGVGRSNTNYKDLEK